MSDRDIDEMDEDYATPPGEDVFQAEDVEIPTVPVEVKGVVEVQALPSRVTGFRTFLITTTAAQRILDDDPRRKCATIVPVDTDIRLGHTQSDAQSTGGTRLPMGVPLLLTSSDEVWACAVTVSCEVSVFSELWAR